MNKKLALVSGKTPFCRFVETAFSGEVVYFSSMEEAGRAALNEPYEAILIPSRPKELHSGLSPEGLKNYSHLWNRGQKVYLEMSDLQDAQEASLFGIRIYGAERAIFTESLVWQNAVLQARCASYQPGMLCGGEELVRAETCIGSHTPIIPGKESFPVLVSHEGFVYCGARISEFDHLTMLPHSRWRNLFADLFSTLLGEDKERVAAAFEKIFPAMKLAGEGNTVPDAARAAVNWLFRSGIMPDDSGAEGCYEMIRSGDLKAKRGQRTDVMLLSAALMCAAGKAYGESRFTACGKNLADHCLKAGLQITEGPNRGVFHWFDLFGADVDRYCYASDNGRDGLAMLNLYRVTGEERYLDSVKSLGEAFLRWADGDAYLKATAFSIKKGNIEDMKRPPRPCNSPVFYDGYAVVLANLYRITGEGKYKEQLKRTADALVADYPNYATNFTPLTLNFVYSRLIIVLCAAQEIGCGDYSDKINELIDIFEALQDPSGGVSDAGLIMADNTYTHEEFAVSMGKGHDKIMDLLYCANNLMACFSIVCDMTAKGSIRRETAERMRRDMSALLLKIQIAEDDDRLKGGWMRAYDMENGEYYGVNKDLGWGPYCIMGGWVMGFLPLLLMQEDGVPSIYGIEK
ncbi:MAG: hypothetical protein J6R89_02610 [Clostridia bacterium]|nr:hypothetical protein [Clostridia bacterium]